MATMRFHQNPFVQTKHFTCFRRTDVHSACTRAHTHTHTCFYATSYRPK